jgi:isoquinoline 1-oxidoreductase subunit beta
VPISECSAASGRISHSSGQSENYGALADAAAKLPLPANLELKARSNWRILGKSTARLDTLPKVDGSPQFGNDVLVPEMLVGTIAACPVFDGKLEAVDDKPALAVKGVKAVVELPDAVAVVGEGYWPCKKGLEALRPQWNEGPNATLDSERIAAALNDGFGNEGAVAEVYGDPAAALQKAAKTVEAIYTLPFLAHATMEPINATAWVTTEGCAIWAPTQVPQWAQKVVAKTLGLEPERVKINTTYLGGGFGRKFEIDFIIQAVTVAKSVAKPVKLIMGPRGGHPARLSIGPCQPLGCGPRRCWQNDGLGLQDRRAFDHDSGISARSEKRHRPELGRRCRRVALRPTEPAY